MKDNHVADETVIRKVSSYIVASQQAELSSDVIEKAKHHILDTLAAIVSGSAMRPGQLAIEYARREAGKSEALVVGSAVVTSAADAALANGMMGHADETDDSHAPSLTHPGCAVVPAALAMTEREGSSGAALLKAVVAGYDIGCRITQALGVEYLHKRFQSCHAIGGLFGAAAAAASAARLDDARVRYALAYTNQQKAGITQWVRDPEHVEKAFVFGGMPARNGVCATIMVQAGFTGVWDPFSGERNFFVANSPESKPELLIEELGSRHEIVYTNIKRFSVGSPVQAAVDALLLLVEKHSLTADNVVSITVYMGDADAMATVNNRDMPDICLQHLLAVTFLDKALSFEAAHAYERMMDPAVLDIRRRVSLAHDAEMATVSRVVRQAAVEVTTVNGSRFREHVVNVRGTVQNPMTTEEVERKCEDLLAPVLGNERCAALVDRIWNLEQVRDVRELRPLLSVS